MILKLGVIFCAIAAQVLGAPKPCYNNCGGSSTYTHEIASGFDTHGSLLSQHNAAFEQLHQSLLSQLQQSQANLNFNRPGTWNEHNAYKANDGGQVYEEHGQVENPNSKLRYFRKNYTNSWGHSAGGIDTSGVNTNVLNTHANVEDFGVQSVPVSQATQSNINTINKWVTQLGSYINLCSERVQAGQLRDYRTYETEVQQHLDRMKQQIHEAGLWNNFVAQITSLEQHFNDLKRQALQSPNVVSTGTWNGGSVVNGVTNQAAVSTGPVSTGGSWRSEQQEIHRTKSESYTPTLTVQPIQPVAPVLPIVPIPSAPHKYTNGYNQGTSGVYQGSVGTAIDHQDYGGYRQHHLEQAGGYNHHIDSNQHNTGYTQQNEHYNQHKGQYNQIPTAGKRVEEEWNASGRRSETTYPAQVITSHTSETDAERLARYDTHNGHNRGYNEGYRYGSSSGYSSGSSFSTFGSTSGGVQTDAANMAYQRGGCDNRDHSSPCKRYKREYRDFSQQNEDLTQQTEDLTQQTQDLTQQTEDLTQQTQDFTQQTQDLIQQNEDLTQQTQDLTQQTEDLTQQTQDLTQQTEDLTQQHVGNLHSGNQRGNRGRNFTPQQSGGIEFGNHDQQQNRPGYHGHQQHGHNDGDQGQLTQQTQGFRDYYQQQAGNLEIGSQHRQHGHGAHGHEQHGHDDGDQEQLTQQTQGFGDYYQQQAGNLEIGSQHRQHGHGVHGHNDGDQGQLTQQTQGFGDYYQQQAGNLEIGSQHRQHGHGVHGHDDGDQGQLTQQTQGFGDYYQQQAGNLEIGSQHRQHGHGAHGHEQHGHNDGNQVYTQQTQGFSDFTQQQTGNLEQSTQHGHNDGDRGHHNQQSQGFGDYYQQQSGNYQFGQQHEQQLGGIELGSHRPSQKPEDLTQQSQGFADLTQQTQGFEDLTQQAHKFEDLSQQTQGFEDLTQQSHKFEDLSQKTQGSEDLTQQTQGFENLSQQATSGIEFGQQTQQTQSRDIALGNKPAPKPPARNHLGHSGHGDTAPEPVQLPPGVKGGRHLSPLQNTDQPLKNPNSEGVVSIEDQIQQSSANQWQKSHQPADLTRENYEQDRGVVGSQNSGAPESHNTNNWEPITTTTTTTPAPGLWSRFRNKVTTGYEKAKETITHTFG